MFFFSDPTYGRKPLGLREVELLPWCLVSPDDKRRWRCSPMISASNGLCFSLDEKCCSSTTRTAAASALDVKADGTLANNRISAKTVGDRQGAPTA